MVKRGLCLVWFVVILFLLGFVSAGNMVDKCSTLKDGDKCWKVNVDNSKIGVIEGNCRAGACVLCGDGIVDRGEDCDLKDQNGVDGSGCASDCTLKLPKPNFGIDPVYAAKTKEERLFIPTNSVATAFDDYACQLIVSPELAKQIDGKLTAQLVTNDVDNNEKALSTYKVWSEEPIVWSTNIKYKNDKNGIVYAMITGKPFKGWPSGIVPQNSLEYLIKVHNLECKIIYNKKVVASSGILPLVNCVQLWGSSGSIAGKPPAAIAIASMRGTTSGLSVYNIMSYGLSVKNDIVDQKSPMKNYGERFAYYVDIQAVDDSAWTLDKFGVFDKNKPVYEKISSCRGATNYLFYTGRELSQPAYNSPLGGKEITIAVNNPEMKKALKNAVDKAKIIAHEMGHAIGLLYDENVIPDKLLPSIRGFLYTNCKKTKEDFQGYGEGRQGCTFANLKSPSILSLMYADLSSSGRYNVISCGYVLKGIFSKGTADEKKKAKDIVALWKLCNDDKNFDVLRPSAV